ncbi:MAG: hypothetical protein ABFD65_07805 [Candidatus Polarisedimenticolia bacterium]
MARFSLMQDARIVQVLDPAADAAGRTGRAVSLGNYQRAYLVAHVTQGNAATVALTPQQCTAVDGTAAKAIPAVPVYTNLDAAGGDSFTRQTDAASFTTDAALKDKIVVFQVDPAALDVAGGFDCIRLNTGASNAANITEATVILCEPRYAGATQPSAIAD